MTEPTTVQPIQSPDGTTGIATPQQGDWVLVWGQVTDTDIHPEDIEVRVRSHNADNRLPVLAGHVTTPSSLPPFARKCSSLYEVGGVVEGWNESVLLRCTRHEGHSGDHISGARKVWTDADADGRVEDG